MGFNITRNQRRQGLNVRGVTGCIAAAIAGAAMLGLGTSKVEATTTYNYVFGTAGTTTDWATAAAWTPTGTVNAVGYPGGDATVVDDIASLVYTGNPAGGGLISAGVNNITLSSALASPLGSLAITMEDQFSGDAVNLVLNANLTVTGAVNLTGGTGSGNLKNGRTTITTAAGTNFVVGGTLKLASTDNVGTANVTINGNASFGGLTMNNDGDNANITASAGNVSLGNVNIVRSQNSTTATQPGLYMLGGNITANNFLVGSGNSSGIVQMAAANLTVTGTFIVGDNSAASARVSSFNQQSGNVTAANSVLQIGSSTVGTSGLYLLTGGMLSVQGIQMTNAGGVAANVANFSMSNNTVLYVGTGGIQSGSGTSQTFSVANGTIKATTGFRGARR